MRWRSQPVRLRYFFFFFSSRRRHTRSKRDWSSDVCSSDLTTSFSSCGPDDEKLVVHHDPTAHEVPRIDQRALRLRRVRQRSEERRVGKECRSRWAPDYYKKTTETRMKQLKFRTRRKGYGLQ